jgi:hypothetical protein
MNQGSEAPLLGRNEQRPDWAPGVNRTTRVSDTQLFDPSLFVVPAPGTRGNVGRNVIPGPGLFTVDASLVKTFFEDDHVAAQRGHQDLFDISPERRIVDWAIEHCWVGLRDHLRAQSILLRRGEGPRAKFRLRPRPNFAGLTPSLN